MALGAALARSLQSPCVIWLRGELGVGKTTLARGAIQYFQPDLRVRSPTYTLIESYALDIFTLHHLDLYRVRDPLELELLGLREFADDVLMIEWPEQGGKATPVADVELWLQHTDAEQRRLQAVPRSRQGRLVLRQLQLILQTSGYI